MVALRKNLSRIAPFLLLAALFVGQATWGDPPPKIYRVTYDDDATYLKVGRERLEKAYGATLIVLPHDGDPNKPIKIGDKEFFKPKDGPLKVDGILFHTDAEEDPKWVVGYDPKKPEEPIDLDRNPMLNSLSVNGLIARAVPGFKDINDKWDESLFLNQFAKALAPKTRLGSDPVFQKKLSASQMREVKERVSKAMKKHGMKDKAVFDQTVKLEILRRQIKSQFGDSILKLRNSFHSEGHLPITHDDWIDTYLTYLKETKPVTERLKREQQQNQSTRSIEDEVVDLPAIEGTVLERFLAQPPDVIVQKLVDGAKEVRLHVVNGKILEGATFLRFYGPGEYLAPDEIQRLEHAIQTHLLDNLKGDLSKLSAGMDVIIDKKGNYQIIDLNAGLDSGYFYPEEDLFTTALLAKHYSGETPDILKEYDHFAQLPLGPEKVEALRHMQEKYHDFMTGDVLNAFWDRMLFNYREIFQKSPTGHRLNAILEELREAGLRDPMIYHQFLSDVRDHWPEAKLTERELGNWGDFIGGLGADLQTYVDKNGNLRARYEDEKKPGAIRRSVGRVRSGKRARRLRLPWDEPKTTPCPTGAIAN